MRLETLVHLVMKQQMDNHGNELQMNSRMTTTSQDTSDQPMNPCIHGEAQEPLPHSILTLPSHSNSSKTIHSTQKMLSLMSSVNPVALTSQTHCGSMSSSTTMLTSTGSTLDTMPLNQTTDTPSQLETLTWSSTPGVVHTVHPKLSQAMVNGPSPLQSSDVPACLHIHTRLTNSMGVSSSLLDNSWPKMTQRNITECSTWIGPSSSGLLDPTTSSLPLLTASMTLSCTTLSQDTYHRNRGQ